MTAAAVRVHEIAKEQGVKCAVMLDTLSRRLGVEWISEAGHVVPEEIAEKVRRELKRTSVTKSLTAMKLAPSRAETETLVFEFVASTPRLDREGDRIPSGAWDLSNYRRNPVVLIAHDAQKLLVGLRA